FKEINEKSEMNNEGSRKRHRLSLENNEEFCPEVEEDTRTQAATTITTTTDTSNSQFSQLSIVTRPSSSKNTLQNKQKPRSFFEVWDYFIKGNEKTNGHYEATCSYCRKIWSREKPAQLEAHLANECASCPDDISRYWCEKVAERDIIILEDQKKAITSRLDQKVIKAWIMAGIPFDIINNPFIRDMFKEFNPAYSPPSRTTLSNRLFDEELARVNKAIEDDLSKADHLTLALDDWMSPLTDSIYNYIITTDTRKEYLIGLKNYSNHSLTGEFLASEISEVIEKIGTDKFAAVVTDAASNCNVAPDLVELESIKKLINDCGKVNRFFKNSHTSNSLLAKGLVDMKIKGGGLKTWVKTHWGSLYSTTDSMLRARPVFDWILADHSESITNEEIKILISNESFFTTCRFVRSVWEPIKEIIHMLEANTAMLADCFVYLIKLAAAIITYLKQTGKGLKDQEFYKAALTSLELWQNLGHIRSEGEELISQLRRFEARLPPYDLPYVANMDTPKICRLREEFFNIKVDFGRATKLTESDLRDACNIASVGNIMNCEDDQMSASSENSLNNIVSDSTTLLIENIVDLIVGNNSECLSRTAETISPADLDYDPLDVLNSFLERENQNLNSIMAYVKYIALRHMSSI
ncbi:34031_t:CDS:2, partial [Gigaspora margarita]